MPSVPGSEVMFDLLKRFLMVVQKSIDPMTAQGYQLSPYTDVHGYMDDTLLLRRRYRAKRTSFWWIEKI